MRLSYTLYRSSGRLEHFTQDCAQIVREAADRNARHGLTGFLHAEEGTFVQWLEGPTECLDTVMGLIASDPRHGDLVTFGGGPVDDRSFPGWHMGFSNGHAAALFDFLATSGVNSHDTRAYAQSLKEFLQRQAF